MYKFENKLVSSYLQCFKLMLHGYNTRLSAKCDLYSNKAIVKYYTRRFKIVRFRMLKVASSHSLSHAVIIMMLWSPFTLLMAHCFFFQSHLICSWWSDNITISFLVQPLKICPILAHLCYITLEWYSLDAHLQHVHISVFGQFSNNMSFIIAVSLGLNVHIRDLPSS